MDRTATFTKKKTSGHEPQLGLDTKTDRLTDRQLQHYFDFDLADISDHPSDSVITNNSAKSTALHYTNFSSNQALRAGS
jgi:hypothetical protein